MTKVIYLSEFETTDELYRFLKKNEKKVKTLVITEEEGQELNRELILTVRTRHPQIKIIYVLSDYQTEKEDFLVMWMVLDILLEYNEQKINALIENPRTVKDFLDFKEEHGRHVDCAWCKERESGVWHEKLT